MRALSFFLFLLTASLLHGQQRFLIRVFDQDHVGLVNFLQAQGGVSIIRNLDFPGQQLNGVAVIVDDAAIGQIRNSLDVQYVGNYRFVLDPPVVPNEGSGDPLGGVIDPAPPTANPNLDTLVPGRPITSPPEAHLPGNVILDIMGTGIDYSHPAFVGTTFLPPLSVIPASGGGTLPGDIDYHNHETRIAGCIAGPNTGLLSELGTASEVNLRSILCYPKPDSLGPSVPTTYATDCIAAMAELISIHEARLASPYLHNHAAVLCFSHSVDTYNTRVGDLDSLFDLAWERGIVTSISAGNYADNAAASSPAGAGEWIVYDMGGGTDTTPYWPPLGYPSYSLPSSVGFEISAVGADYHLKTGAHNNASLPVPWYDSGTLGSGINTPNPVGFGPPMNNGVDLFAPGQTIPVPATRLHAATGAGPVIADGSTYYLKQGFQTGNGTSYSAAYTAALAARILQLRPWATPAQVREVILTSATPAGPINVLTVPDLSSLDPMSLTYDDWIARYEQVAPLAYFAGGQDDFSADPDGDGIANFIEYYCGMDPRFPDAHHAPDLSFNHQTHTFSVTMQRACYLPKLLEVDWTFQACDDLIGWEDFGQGTITPSPHTDDNGDGVTITADLELLSVGDPKHFFRFSIFVTD